MPRFWVAIIFIRSKKLVKISAQLPVSLSSNTRSQCKTPGPSHIWTHRETPPGLYLGNWPPLSSPVKVSHSAVSDSLKPHGLYSLQNSPGQNTGVGSLSLLQGIFTTRGSNPGLPHCRRIIYQLSHRGSPRILKWVAYPFSSRSSRPRNWTRVSCTAGRFFTNWTIREALLPQGFPHICVMPGAQTGQPVPCSLENIQQFVKKKKKKRKLALKFWCAIQIYWKLWPPSSITIEAKKATSFTQTTCHAVPPAFRIRVLESQKSHLASESSQSLCPTASLPLCYL